MRKNFVQLLPFFMAPNCKYKNNNKKCLNVI